MPSFKQNLQKFFVYFFTGVSVIIVVLGISRVKKGDQLATAPELANSRPDAASSPDQGANAGFSQSGTRLAVRGATQTAFNGRAYQTPWGNLAVAIQVKDGKVTAVSIPTLPDSPPSQQAKAYLIEQAIRSGGANIQGVSGATITSMAFKASLESALSQAANASSAIASGGTNTAIDTFSSTPQPLPNTPTVQVPRAVAPTTPTPLATQNTTATAKAGVSGTFTGNAYATPWGNAVASITITNGKITGVTMPVVPNSPPSQQAEPYLIQQALSAGSANIQGVSGATYASIAFKSSLESAIAKANSTASAQGQATVVSAPTTASTVNTATPASIPSIRRGYDYDDDDKEDWDD